MNNKQRTMNYELRTDRAFTLIELVVAVALLAMVLSFASVIFRVSIEAYRTAGANTEIMQKLRAVTDQLNADFRGLQADAPLLIWFEQEPNDPRQRFDQIMFFADGDFQSIQMDEPVSGNVARIFYGQAQSNGAQEPSDLPEEERLLARRRHILTADTDLDEWLFDATNNERYEHDRLSLAQWKTVDGGNYDGVDGIIDICFDYRPLIDMRDPNTFHKLMCEGVGSFAIQWSYWHDDADDDLDGFRWFPSNNPDGDAATDDSDFDSWDDEFGFYFNIPGSISDSDWPYGEMEFTYRAFRFTFTLYDSRGVLEGGRTFTHIVYLGD